MTRSQPSAWRGDHERLFAFVELAQFALLHHQHAQQLAPMNDRHPEEGSETILFHLRNVFETGVALGIGGLIGSARRPTNPTTPSSNANAIVRPRGFFSPRVAIR